MNSCRNGEWKIVGQKNIVEIYSEVGFLIKINNENFISEFCLTQLYWIFCVSFRDRVIKKKILN